MANRHKFAKGGGVAPKHDRIKKAYNAKGSNVVKEAEEKNRGGKVKHVETRATGGKAMPRLDKRARGGGVKASGKDMTKSPFSAAHSGHTGAPATNYGGKVHRGK